MQRHTAKSQARQRQLIDALVFMPSTNWEISYREEHIASIWIGGFPIHLSQRFLVVVLSKPYACDSSEPLSPGQFLVKSEIGHDNEYLKLMQVSKRSFGSHCSDTYRILPTIANDILCRYRGDAFLPHRDA